MNSLLIALSSILLSAMVVDAKSPVETHGRLRVLGTQLVDESETAVTLRGMSLFPHNVGIGGGEYWRPSVIQSLQTDWYASVVRIPISARMAPQTFETEGFVEDSAEAVSRAFRVVDAAIASGVYVVVQFRATNLSSDLTAAKSFFHAMTIRYRDVPNLLWEIFHESQASSWSDIASYAEQVIPVIRQRSQGVIIVATPGFSGQPHAADKRLEESFSNLAYALHFTADRNEARTRVSQANANGLPLFATEWAVTVDDGADSIHQEDINDWLATLDSFGISHCNLGLGNRRWNAVSVTAPSTLTIDANPVGPWSDQELTPSGTFMRNLLRSRNPQWSLSDTALVESLRIASPKSMDLLLGVDSIHLAARYNMPVTWMLTLKARHGTASISRTGTGHDVSVQLKVATPPLSTAKFREGDTVDVELMPEGATLWFTIQGPTTHRSHAIAQTSAFSRGNSLRIRELDILAGVRVELKLLGFDGREKWSGFANSAGQGEFVLETELPTRSSPQILLLDSKSKHWRGLLAPSP